MISIDQLALYGILYLAALFGLVWLSERGFITHKIVCHPLTYILSLGIYTSAWAFYGSIALAHAYGYGFLAYYLGISIAFMLTPILLEPLAQISRRYQLTSLADLFAFRFRSTWAGGLTALLSLIGILPLMAMQIKAVADTAELFSGQPIARQAALSFCLSIALLSMLFGGKHAHNRGQHAGLVAAIAFESLIKLLCMTAVCTYAVYGVFGGWEGLNSWLHQDPEHLNYINSHLNDGAWRTLFLAFFAAAIVMPHLYHMLFTEQRQSNALGIASWGFPIFLLLMALAVPLILWAGLSVALPVAPEYFMVGLSLHSGNTWLAVAAYIGGLAAASGLLIVLTWAVSGIALKHLILPFYTPFARYDIYRWLKWSRRILGLIILTVGYALYLCLDGSRVFVALGLAAFLVCLHFLPGVLALLYWPGANRQGFIAGLLAGILLWLASYCIPLIYGAGDLLVALNTLDLNAPHWYLSVLGALSANFIVLALVSHHTQTQPNERAGAEICAVNRDYRPAHPGLFITSAHASIAALTPFVGDAIAERTVVQALADLQLRLEEQRPYALQQLRDRLEANLTALIGPSIAHRVITKALPYNTEEGRSPREHIQSIEHRLEEYRSRLTGLAAELDDLRRYHRKTLQELPLGVCSLSKDQTILLWNRAMELCTQISANSVIGLPLAQLTEPWRSLLQKIVTSSAEYLHKESLLIDQRTRWFGLRKAVIDEPSTDNSGLVILLEDLTEVQLLEDKLVHSERLASIGRLAAGVAHEIGNPVTGIACLAQNLRYEHEGEVALISYQILEQTQRISKIMHSLVSFAHAGAAHQTNQPVCLADCAAEAIALLSLNRDGQLVLFSNHCDPTHIATANPQRITQVLLNLLSNARDASPPNANILVYTLAHEQYLELCVEDEGSGIPETISHKLFEPFFTTKDPGKGTGLGLALVYSIVEEHSGEISIESPVDATLNRGTCVRIKLPRYPYLAGALDLDAFCD